MGKVRFGLDEVHYSLLTEGEGGALTWATPVPMPGAVSLSLDVEGDESSFYADNSKWFTDVVNGGYSGELEMAYIDDSVKVALLDYATVTTGSSGNTTTDYVEKANPSPAPFALLFRVSGNQEEKGYCIYNCKLSRPSISAETTGESVDPNTITLPISATSVKTAAGANILLRSHDLAASDDWFTTAPTLPTLDA